LEDIGCRDTIGSGHGMRGVCLWLRFGSAGGTDHEEPRPLTMTDRKRYLVTVFMTLVIMRIRQLNHMVSHHSAAAPTSRHHAFLYMHRLTFTNSLDSLPNQGSLHCLALFRPFPHSMDVFELPVFRWKPFLPFWSDHQATRRSGPGQTGLWSGPGSRSNEELDSSLVVYNRSLEELCTGMGDEQVNEATEER
jgi:hypothetical protein